MIIHDAVVLVVQMVPWWWVVLRMGPWCWLHACAVGGTHVPLVVRMCRRWYACAVGGTHGAVVVTVRMCRGGPGNSNLWRG